MDMSPPTILRPKDFALLLLASGDLLPRQRARDQEADVSGSALKVRVLQALIGMDPEPDALEAALQHIVLTCTPPPGPTRAIALSILEEWQMACASPALVEWLLAQAVQAQDMQEDCAPTEGHRRGRKNRRLTPSSDTGAS